MNSPAVYNSAGYPVTETVDGNLTVVDVYGTGQYGIVTAAQFVGPTSGTAATATAANGLNTLTTTVFTNAGSAPTSGQILTATSGSAATWQAAPAGFVNPMTTAGDLIDGGTAGAAQRLAVGTVGQVLTVGAGTAPTWAASSSLLPLTTQGDLLYENATPAPARLAIGSTGNVLTVAGGVPTWAAAASTAPQGAASGTKATVTGTVISDIGPTYSVPGNTAAAGVAYEMRCQVNLTTSTTTGQITLGAYWGGVAGTLLGSLILPLASGLFDNAPGFVVAHAVVVFTSSSATTTTLDAHLQATSDAENAGDQMIATANAATGLSTSGAETLTWGWTFSSASGSPSATPQSAFATRVA